MKVLFITTYNVSFQGEHFFTINVFKALKSLMGGSITLCTFFERSGVHSVHWEEVVDGGEKSMHVVIPSNYSRDEKISAICSFFEETHPSIIHSNMIEGIELEAAYALNIPSIVSTHIGGLLCPRGGGDGFRDDQDRICDNELFEHCWKCQAKAMPLPLLASLLIKCMPRSTWGRICELSERHAIPYITELALRVKAINERSRMRTILSHSCLIAPNRKLQSIYARCGLSSNVVYLPHGVRNRTRLPFPPINQDGVIHFCYLGRLQYSKGAHVLFEALRGIPNQKYKLHVVGAAPSSSRSSRRYVKRLQRLSKGSSVVWHGAIQNDAIETVLTYCHCVIHPAIFLEIYGIAIAESLAIGRPVLATRCGGAEEQIKDEWNGWLIPPNDVSALREKLMYLIKNPATISNCADHCKLPHDVNDYAHELNSIYIKLTRS